MFSGDKKTITTLGLILGGFVIAQTALLAYWTRLKKNDEQLASELEVRNLYIFLQNITFVYVFPYSLLYFNFRK